MALVSCPASLSHAEAIKRLGMRLWWHWLWGILNLISCMYCDTLSCLSSEEDDAGCWCWIKGLWLHIQHSWVRKLNHFPITFTATLSFYGSELLGNVIQTHNYIIVISMTLEGGVLIVPHFQLVGWGRRHVPPAFATYIWHAGSKLNTIGSCRAQNEPGHAWWNINQRNLPVTWLKYHMFLS